MIVQERTNKNLVVPSALGNFGNNGGGGGITPEEAAAISSAVTEAYIEEYDTEIQVDLEDIRENVSGVTSGLTELSGSTSAIAENISTLSGSTAANVQNIETLSGATRANTENIAALSGATTANTQNIQTLSGATETLAGQVNDQFHSIEALSGVTSALTLDLAELSGATAGKQDALTAGNGISITNDTVSVKAGEGLGFSGDTLVVSGASSGPKEYYINNMTQPELLALYNEISGITGGNSDSPNIPQIFNNYRFYIYWGVDGQKWCEAFFSNWENNDLWIIGMKPTKLSYGVNIYRSGAQIHPDGSVDYSESTLPDIENAANDFTIAINSGGTIIDTSRLGDFSSLSKFNRVQFIYNDTNIQNNYCSAPLDYFWRRQEGNDLMEYFGCTININGVQYKGEWKTPEWGWSSESLPADKWEPVSAVLNGVVFMAINSGGTLAGPDDPDFSYLSYDNWLWRLQIALYDNNGNKAGWAIPKWSSRYPITPVSWTDRMGEHTAEYFYTFAADIEVDSTMYSGVWGILQNDWYNLYNSFEVLSWTSGATYESQTYPAI